MRIGQPQFGTGPVYAASTTLMGLEASEPGQSFYAVDGGAFNLFTASFTVAAEGAHEVTFYSRDLSGNQEGVKSESIFTDATAPATALLINGQPAAGAVVTAISTDSFAFAATDGGAGVAEIRFSLDGGAEETFLAPFTLAAGSRQLRFYARDRLGNLEAARTVTASVSGPDTQGPSLTFSLAAGATITAQAPLIGVAFFDDSGVVPASVRFFLDGTDVTGQAVITPTSASFTPPGALSQGAHLVEITAGDNYGNLAQAAFVFYVDSIAPSLSVAPPDGSTVTAARPLISAQYSDSGSGVEAAGVRLYLDGLDLTGQAAVQELSASLVPAADLAQGYHTASARVADRAGNVSASTTTFFLDSLAPATQLAIGTPRFGNFVTPATPLNFTASEPSQTYYAVDGGTFAAAAGDFTLSLEGLRTVYFYGEDPYGNREVVKSSQVFVDATAPATVLKVNGVAVSTEALVITSTDAVSFLAADSGAGVLETLAGVDGAPPAPLTGSLTLAAGTRSLQFFSRDRVGNTEAAASAQIEVLQAAGDQDPPLAQLSFPSPGALGLERAVGGVVRVRGSVLDAGAVDWSLELAPGLDASYGFTPIFNAAGNASGVLHQWDTAGLSGYHTLRLVATDGNHVTMSTASVYIGRPVFDFAIGKRAANVTMDMNSPMGVAVRGDGNVWVSNSVGGRMLLLSPAGQVLAEAGSELLSSPLHFAHPHGIAVDSANNLYIADKDRHRVVKLSPDGGQILLALGKTNAQGDWVYGSQDGEFNQPFDVEVSSDGFIFVADQNNHRVQVFNAQGGFVRAFPVNPLGGTSAVWGLALVPDGLWVADNYKKLVYGYSGNGTLKKIIDESSSPAGNFSPLRGAGADSLGSFYVSDALQDRLQKFDPEGYALLEFGPRVQATQAEKDAIRFLTVPTESAAAPDGSLWIADTGNNRVVRYALPPQTPVPQDLTAPVTELLINGAATAASSLVIASTDAVAFRSVDSESGVLDVLYSVDGAPSQAFVDPFQLPAGAHSLTYQARDGAGNLEAPRTVAFTVNPPSAITLRLDYPAPGAVGVEKLMGMTVRVRGSVWAEAAVSWTIETADGQNAQAGFSQLAAGSGNASGGLYDWNTTGLSGYKTLRLTAQDAYTTLVATAVIYLGKPAMNLAIGKVGYDYYLNLSDPRGVAVRSDGNIWISNTGADRLVLVTPLGQVLANVGEDPLSSPLHFSNPHGIALDGSGNLYVADKGRHRVVKLSPDGTQILLTLGKVNAQGNWVYGSGDGEFNQPFDVEISSDGFIFVADQNNKRVQVFSAQGAFVRAFGTNPLGGVSAIWGLGLGPDRVWTADMEKKLIYGFDRNGTLKTTINEYGSPAGSFSPLRGLGADSLGAFFVAEGLQDRLQKFDPEGLGQVSFGPRNQATQAEIDALRFLSVPSDAARGPDGALWVADSGHNRIVRYALPTGGMTASAFQPTLAKEESSLQAAAPAKPAAAPSAPMEFFLREAYAVPNPCKGCGSQGFVVQVGLADSVNLECRNVMGRVVHQNAFGAPILKDTGNGHGVQYTYEQLWRVSGVGNGIYTCTMTARKAGKADVRKIIRSAVIK